MKKSIQIFLIIFYIIVLLGASWDLSARWNNEESISNVDVYNISFFNWMIAFTLPLIILFSIISLFLTWKFKLPKFTKIYPIYFLIFLLYEYMSLKIIYAIYPFEKAVLVVDAISKYDIAFYFIDIILSLYFFYRLCELNKK